MAEPLRILVVSDDALARAGLATLLASQALAAIGPFPSVTAVRHAVAAPPPDAAIWDVTASNLDRMRELEDIPILALIDEESRAAEALGVGARGVLLRDCPPRRMASALRAIVEGSLVLDEPLASLLRTREPLATQAEPLTAREKEVLQQLALGLSNKEIARRLSVSEHTAKFHVNAILGKLGAQSRTEAVVRAAQLGLLVL